MIVLPLIISHTMIGRQLDSTSPPLAVLLRIRKERPELINNEKGFEIYLDGGIRRGSDVLKALCLGAKGVGIGRPMLFAMVLLIINVIVRFILTTLKL